MALGEWGLKATAVDSETICAATWKSSVLKMHHKFPNTMTVSQFPVAVKALS
jgi:hypothetical protein